MLYSEGCKITIGGSWNQDAVTASDPEEDRKQIAEAVEVAKQADVIVLAIGGNEQTSREAWNLQHMGDRTSLDLIGRQEELVKAMVATGQACDRLPVQWPPSVDQLRRARMCRRSSSAGIWDRRLDAPWPRCCSATTIPAASCRSRVPRSAGHVPVFYNYKPSARRGYLFDDVSPLYAFGYGLSYTTFELRTLRLTKQRIPRKGSTQVLVDVTNTGKRAGAEVVQLYIRDLRQFCDAAGEGVEGLQKSVAQARREQDCCARYHTRSRSRFTT